MTPHYLHHCSFVLELPGSGGQRISLSTDLKGSFGERVWNQLDLVIGGFWLPLIYVSDHFLRQQRLLAMQRDEGGNYIELISSVIAQQPTVTKAVLGI